MKNGKTISAGGVIVKKIEQIPHVLLIRNKQYTDWVLPKGHVEAGESLEKAALREVAEEAGLHHIRIVKLLGSYERYVEKTEEQKTIHYFLMMPTSDEKPVMTAHNENDDIRWFPLDQLPMFYLSEQQDVIEKNKEQIRKEV